MIVLDENLHDEDISTPIAKWYPGRVISIIDLRPQSIIKDEAIATLLQQVNHATFVTINVSDFWKKMLPASGYCIIVIELPKERSTEIPTILRRLLQLELFKTKAARMGKVIRWTPTRIEYYDSMRRITTIPLD